MVNTPPLKDPDTPAGNAPAVIEAFVPVPPMAYVIGAIELLMHLICAFVPTAELSVTVPLGVTVIVPPRDGLIHNEPVVVTV